MVVKIYVSMIYKCVDAIMENTEKQPAAMVSRLKILYP